MSISDAKVPIETLNHQMKKNQCNLLEIKAQPMSSLIDKIALDEQMVCSIILSIL